MQATIISKVYSSIGKLAFPLLLLAFHGLGAQAFQFEDRYTVYQDLNSLEQDAISIRIITPLISVSTVVFQMPKVVPGTYSVHNYGLFVRKLQAFSATGDTLPLKRLGINSWQIDQASQLYRIDYRMEDSFDSEERIDIFPPSGSSNEERAFLLNQFAYIGYLRGYKDLDFEVQIRHPKAFYGSSAWPGERSDSLDVFRYPNYFQLHDNPLLYCAPDTSSIRIGNSRVELSIYSPNKKVGADSTMMAIREVLEASAKYLGGNLPVELYSILVYCEEDMEGQFSYGALEHHRSTVLYMPEIDASSLYQSIRDIVAHEFLHIVTPLGIHSEYVHDFDFADPEMSRHLWLYEGVTEYTSHLVQVRDGLYSKDEFIDVMWDKFLSNDQYDSIPLTLASRHTLDLFPENYQNFYEGGAIAAMALDLFLIEQSQGQMRLADLLQELSAVYHADTFFVDEDFFDIMAQYSFPQTKEFMVRHFAGGQDFPWERLFANVGIRYQETGVTYGWSLGCDAFSYDLEQGRFIIASEEGIDDFGRDLGLRLLDQIISLNGDTLAIYNFQEVLEDYQNSLREGDKVEIVVARPKRKEGFKIKTLKAVARQIPYEESHFMELMTEPTEEQLRLQRIWLNQ